MAVRGRFFTAAFPAAVFLLLLPLVSPAALEVPGWTGPVNDSAGVMTENEESELTVFLTELNDSTGIQMAVLTIPSLEGESIEEFSIRVAETWKLGQKDKDNGALLLVSLDDRELRIETGYGLESSLTDMKCGLIIRNVITPYFRNGDYGEGITAGIKNMAGIASGDESMVEPSLEREDSDIGIKSIIAASVFFIIFFSIVSMGLISHIRRHGGIGGGGGFSGGGFGGFSGGGFGGGGSSGGGFSGGGGGFGGGGASGGW